MKRSPTQPQCTAGSAGCLVLFALCLSGRHSWAAPSPGPTDEVFLDVVANARFFKAPETHPTITARLRQPAQVDLLIYDLAGRLRRHADAAGADTRCEFTLADLPAVPKGAHFFWLVATGADGQRLGVYPRDAGGGEIIQVRDSVVDQEKQIISYQLPRAACVRVRAGFRDGPYLQPIISAAVQAAGRHEVNWDGAGQKGVFRNLYQHPALQVNVLAVSLPVNLLVADNLGASAADTNRFDPPTLSARVADLAAAPPAKVDAKARSFWIQDDYDLTLAVTQDAATRVAEVRVDCAAPDRSRLTNRRFELMVFLDTTFFAEDERSQLPFNYRMSTRGLAPGRHIVTVNTIDPDGNVGTRSEEFEVSKAPEKL